jgi:hypothetical protein
MGTNKRRILEREGVVMAKYCRGDRVSWNSEATWISGNMIKSHDADVGQWASASVAKDHLQYEVKSDKTEPYSSRQRRPASEN